MNYREELMPEISRFFGIVIKMYYNDHAPPHLHAEYQDYQGMFDMRTGDRIGGYIPIKAEKLVKKWISDYREELMEVWELMREGKPFKKIQGADR